MANSPVPADESYEERLARIAAAAAPRLTAAQVEWLRGVLAPALRSDAEVAPVVALPTEPTNAPRRAA